MMPVPGAAGINKTLAAPNLATISCGIVASFNLMGCISLRATDVPFRTASGTAPAFPSPEPTFPAPSPTTTMALKVR